MKINFEKIKEIVKNKEVSFEEMYHGIAFLYYLEIITREEYHELMQLWEG